MEWREEVQLVEVVMGDNEYVLEDCERVFSVGDLVEFWEGPLVRGYRTDSGDPAYAKEILGLGWYGIKMVGSFRGRNRRVHWKSIFKDGKFQKQVGSGGGSRVRTKVRMQEREKKRGGKGKVRRRIERDQTGVNKSWKETTRNGEKCRGETEKARDGGKKGRNT
jgi:hypothetical protein